MTLDSDNSTSSYNLAVRENLQFIYDSVIYGTRATIDLARLSLFRLPVFLKILKVLLSLSGLSLGHFSHVFSLCQLLPEVITSFL